MLYLSLDADREIALGHLRDVEGVMDVQCSKPLKTDAKDDVNVLRYLWVGICLYYQSDPPWTILQ